MSHFNWSTTILKKNNKKKKESKTNLRSDSNVGDLNALLVINKG